MLEVFKKKNEDLISSINFYLKLFLVVEKL